MTRAEVNEALKALVCASTWAEKAVEVEKARAEREGRYSRQRDADALSVCLTRMREGRESAARALGMVGEE
jgi:hypothetical protein